MVVTGASGFLGRAVVPLLRRHGVRAIAATRSRRREEGESSCIVVAGYANLQAPEPGSVLVHLAEPRDIAAADGIGDAHLERVRDTLQALLPRDWVHVVYASSAAVYGDERAHSLRPDEPLRPRGAYAEAKAACERVVEDAGGTVLRLANVYGPGMADNNVISDILRQLPGRESISVRDASPVRDYVWVDDVARAFAAAVAKRPGGALNIGTGRGISVGELARTIVGLAGAIPREIVSARSATPPSQIVLDIAATTAALGWRPEMTLERGLKSLLGAAP